MAHDSRKPFQFGLGSLFGLMAAVACTAQFGLFYSALIAAGLFELAVAASNAAWFASIIRNKLSKPI